jgi:amidase
MIRPLLLVIFLATVVQACQPAGKRSDQELPMPALQELTIASIHEHYRNKTFTSEELVAAYLERIREKDSVTNAITQINADALATARRLDSTFQATGKLLPLHGVPIIVKDNINTRGLATTAGSMALKNFIPEQDAFIIRQLTDAGAIVMAKSNMAEWAFSPMHSESSTNGTTRNPYNTAFVPAGSSGGTAAAVATNMGAAGLGTDTGNSIRGPSAHCALVGFRTTLGLISRSGIVPLYLRNDVVGPMCRTVEDATRLMEVMAGEDPLDSLTKYSAGKVRENYTQYLDANGLQGARIGVLGVLGYEDVNPEVLALFQQAVTDLRNAGAEVVDSVAVPQFNSLRRNQWCGEFRKDLEAFLATYVPDTSVQTLEDVIAVGTASEFARNRLARNAANSGRGGETALPCDNPYVDELRIAFREAIENTMDSLQLDALIYPSWRHKPAHLNQFMEEYKGDNSQVISPHTGQPAFTVPMGYTEGNLPAGLQFLGRMYAEPTLVKLTYAYEQATQHRKAPSL